MKESYLQNSIVGALHKEFGQDNLFIFNVHGGKFQTPGIPDLLICYKGLFIGLEVKVDEKKYGLTKMQEYMIRRINGADGYACVVHSTEEAISAVYDAILKKHRKNVN